MQFRLASTVRRVRKITTPDRMALPLRGSQIPKYSSCFRPAGGCRPKERPQHLARNSVKNSPETMRLSLNSSEKVVGDRKGNQALSEKKFPMMEEMTIS